VDAVEAGTTRTALITCPGCGRRNRLPVAARGRPRCAACHTDLPWLVEAGDGDFSAAVEESPVPVLVDVWAPWCGPCRMVAPVVEQLARERAGRLKVVKVNADEAPAVSAKLGVRSIPTMLVFSGGRERARTVGALPAPALTAWVDGQLT
jgi:thioredoxin 2